MHPTSFTRSQNSGRNNNRLININIVDEIDQMID